MNIREAVECVREIAPERYSAAYTEKYGDYDNTGFLIGEPSAPCRKILVALDVTQRVAAEAEKIGASLIVSHHPFLFYPVHAVTGETPFGKTAIALIKAGIAVYAAHLSLDCTLVNDVLADALGITNTEPLMPALDSGAGRVGDLKEELTLAGFTARVRDVLGDPTVFAAGDAGKKLKRVAVVGGAGGGDLDYLRRAQALGADAYLSGDFKHHVLLEAQERGIAAVSASHYALEALCLPAFARLIKNKTNLDVLVSDEGYPYLTIGR